MNASGTTPEDPNDPGNLAEDASDEQGGLANADSGAHFNDAVEQRLAEDQDADSTTSAQTETEDDKTELPVLEEQEDSPVKPQNS